MQLQKAERGTLSFSEKNPNNKQHSLLPKHPLTFDPLDPGILDSLNRPMVLDPSMS